MLKHIWTRDFSISDTRLYTVDAKAHFNVSAPACLLVCRAARLLRPRRAVFSAAFSTARKISAIGMHEATLLADQKKYKKWSQLDGQVPVAWRSGIKHDCVQVMEFIRREGAFVNGLDERVDIEDEFVFPLYKSSAVAKGLTNRPERWVLITQKSVGDDTRIIRESAPKTWSYLTEYADELDQRKSSVYQNKPRFSIFASAIIPLPRGRWRFPDCTKGSNFQSFHLWMANPQWVDDTCYFLPCTNRNEAVLCADLLNSKAAREFLRAFIFWDAKRPITAHILKRLDLRALAKMQHKTLYGPRADAEISASQFALF